MRASRLEWLLTGPWRLVLLIALVVGLPVLILGELSDVGAREGVRQDELRVTADAAQRAADTVAVQVRRVSDSLRGATSNNDLKAAAERADREQLQILLRDFRAVMTRDVRRLFVLTYQGGELIAQAPFDDRAIGTVHSDRDYFLAFRKDFLLYGGYYLSSVYHSDESEPRPLVAISAYIQGPFTQSASFGAIVGVLVAELDLSAVRQWLAPVLLGAAEDLYVVDGRGRLIGQAAPLDRAHPDADLRSLIGNPTVAAALRGTTSPTETADPLGRGDRLVAIVPTAAGPPALSRRGPDAHWNWQVVAVRHFTLSGTEIEAALVQARALRIGAVLLLVAAAYVVARASRSVLRHRRALAETNARLARASEAKSQFLASVSHELRTPLNAILGFTDALLAGVDGPINDEQRASLGWVKRGGQDLLGLINEVLDLSRIEAGKIAIAPESFSPKELVESVSAQYRSLAADKGITLSWRDEGAPIEVILDRQRTRQILVNLCGNALKFTDRGAVDVVLAGADRGVLLIEVRDTGKGIPAEEYETIFEEFRQIDRTAPGTGLGLAISRRLARLMGGDISVESELGSGSVFRLQLPLDCRVPEAAVQEVPATDRIRLVLAVDDDPSVAPLLEKMLADRGYRVVGVTSAGLALAEARRLRPSAITLDILMPDRDGRELLHELRSDPLTRDIPVIVLSVVDSGDAPSEADAHLMKPVRRDPLLRALERVAATGAGRS